MRASFLTVITAAIMSSAGKLIAALGFGAITYTGLALIQSKFISAALSNWNNLPANAIQVALIGGVGVAMNWVFGAIAFVVAYKSIAKFGLMMKGNNT